MRLAIIIPTLNEAPALRFIPTLNEAPALRSNLPGAASLAASGRFERSAGSSFRVGMMIATRIRSDTGGAW